MVKCSVLSTHFMFLLIDIDVLGKKVSQNEIFFRNIKEILFWYRFVGHAQLNSLKRADNQKICSLKKTPYHQDTAKTSNLSNLDLPKRQKKDNFI